MHGGAIFGFQSDIQRIPNHRELIVILDNSDITNLLSIVDDIRSLLAANHP
jgi:hypothetical protein